MFHVVHVIDHMGLGGAQNVLERLLPELVMRGFVVTLVVLRGDVPRAATLRQAGVAVEPLRLARYYPWQVPVVLQRLKRLKPDILHASLFRSWLLAELYAWADRRVKLVLYDHNGPIQALKAPALLRYIAAILQRRSAWRVDAYICVSQAVAVHAQQMWHAAPDKTQVIYNPFTEVTIQPAQRQQARHALGVDDRLVVLALGRLSFEKGHDILIDAVHQLRQEGQVLPRVLVAGDGPMREQLQAQIVRLELQAHVQLLGRRSDTADLLAAADIVVQPSRFEPLSLSILEAMSAGLPVVGSRIGGIPELILDETTGLLVQAESVGALATALARLLSDEQLRQRLGQSGYQRFRQHFGSEQAIEQIASCYTRLLGDGSASNSLPKTAALQRTRMS